MFASRTGAGATQETSEDLHCQDDEHQEPVEKHCGAVCQLVSVLCFWLGLYRSFFFNQRWHLFCWESMKFIISPPLRDIRISSLFVCVFGFFAQADRLWDPPLFRSQYDGPGGPAHCSVPRRLLHYGWHRCGNLPGAVSRGGVDGSAWRPAHLHDNNGAGIATTAGSTQLWVKITQGVSNPNKKDIWNSTAYLFIDLLHLCIHTHVFCTSASSHDSHKDSGPSLCLIGPSPHSPLFFWPTYKNKGHHFRLQWFSWRHFIFCLLWVSTELSFVFTNDAFSFLLPFNIHSWKPVIGKYSLRHDTGTVCTLLA